VNRFRFLGDSLGYAVGRSVYKYDATTNTSAPALAEANEPALRLLNYPNPLADETTFRFFVPDSRPAQLVVYDVLGRVVSRLVDGMTAAGEHEIVWPARGTAPGVYQ